MYSVPSTDITSKKNLKAFSHFIKTVDTFHFTEIDCKIRRTVNIQTASQATLNCQIIAIEFQLYTLWDTDENVLEGDRVG